MGCAGAEVVGPDGDGGGGVIYPHDPNPEFCSDPKNKKPHAHHNGGNPTCSAHGMMHQPQKFWLCMDPDCKVKWQPKAGK